MREQYLVHATINTGHARRSYRSEVDDSVIRIVQSWLPDLAAGGTRFVLDDRYAVQQAWRNSKAAGFVIVRATDDMRYTPIIKFAVCGHSRYKKSVWEQLGGQGEPPGVPFVAVALIEEAFVLEDLEALGVLADVERCIAWAFLED